MASVIRNRRWFSPLILVLALSGLLVACQAPPAAVAPSPTPAKPVAASPTPAAAPSPTPAKPVAASPTPEKPIVLKYGSPLPAPPAPISVGTQWWLDEVAKRTGGRVKFESFWGGALFSPGENLDAVEKRIVDVAWYAYVYVPGKTPLGNFNLAIPFRPTSVVINTKIMRALFDEIPAFDLELAKYKAKRLFLQPAMNYDVSSRMPIETLDDFKGKKLAIIGLWFPEITAATGAVPVTMPAGERYAAFERGVLDGQILTVDLMQSFKHYEVQKHFTSVPLGAIVGSAVVVHVDAWNALPPDIQKTMIEVGNEAEPRQAEFMDKQYGQFLEQWKGYGVTFHRLPDADVAKWAAQMPDIPAQWAKEMEVQGLPGWKIMERYIELAEKAGHKWPRKFAVR